MGSDFSRERFDPKNSYSGVLMQQGRVQLDADWNEQVDVVDRRLRAETVDLLGRCGVPEETPDGFKIELSGGQLTIGPGRMYVHGLLAENRGKEPSEFDEVLAEERGTQPLPYGEQPFFPEAEVQAPLPQDPGTHLAYLEVWQREVTPLEEPDLIEKAVGVDTTTRRQTVWQVKVLPDVGEISCATPDDEIPGWLEKNHPSAGRLSTEAVGVTDVKDPCLLPPSGGYKGLENHLYRVEIHDGGPPDGTATWKWSRDNGIVASAVTAIPTLATLQVDRIGRDDVLCFHDGEWVEITDDVRELAGEPGVVRKIKKVHDATRIIELESDLPANVFPTDPPPDNTTDPERHTRVRRWDQQGEVKDTDGNPIVDLNAAGSKGVIPVPAAGTSVVLEDGVQITFHTPDPEKYRSGDYWVFAARTADASVEQLQEAPPRGIHRHYCRLALIHLGASDDETYVIDCRRPWPPPRCCTITVKPGQDVQAAIDRVPPEGGRVCLLPGVHRLRRPLLIDGRLNLTLTGCGRGSKLVFDPDRGEDLSMGSAVLYVAGASRNFRLESLSVYTDWSLNTVVVDEGSVGVSVADVVVLNVFHKANTCILLGRCSAVSVERSTLLGIWGIVQAEPDLLQAVADSIVALRSWVSIEEEGNCEGVESGETPVENAPPQFLTLRDLDIRQNDVLALLSVRLVDAIGGHIVDNRLFPIPANFLDSFRRPAVDTPEVPPNLTGDASQVTDTENDFFARLHERFSELELYMESFDPAATDDLPLIGTWISAHFLEDFTIVENEIWGSVGCSWARGVGLEGNRIQSGGAGVSFGYGFDVSVEKNTIRVTPPVSEPDHGEGGTPESDPVKMILDSAPDPAELGIRFGFARGARVSGNAILAPSAIGTSRQARAGFPRECGASWLRLLRIERPWRVVVELGWLIKAIFGLFSQAKDPADERESKAEFEEDLREKLRSFLTSSWLPVFIGKAVVAENRLETSRYGIFFDQVLTLGGLRVLGNRVSGFERTGIRIHPLYSIGLVDRFARWTHCFLEWLLDFLQKFYDALCLFIDERREGSETRIEPDAATLTISVISAFLALCARLRGQAGDTDEGEAEETEKLPVENLKDALEDLLAHVDRSWLDDLVNQSYRVDGNTVRGRGTGIWVGIDGTRVTGNRVTIHSDNPVPCESIVLGGLLLGFQNLFGSILMELDRDLIFLYCWMIHKNQIEIPSDLSGVVTNFDPYVALTSPLRPHLVALKAAASGSEVKAAWTQLVLAIWQHLEGYGIVLVGADMICDRNRVDAETACRLGMGEQDERKQDRPAVGGIWHFPNWGFYLGDLARLFLLGDEWRARIPELLLSYLLFLALAGERNRTLEISSSQIRKALVHGVRVRAALGLTEVDLRDNFVEDAARIGIQFRGDDPTVKVQRNTVIRTEEVYPFEKVYPFSELDLAAAGLLEPFRARLIEIRPWLADLFGKQWEGKGTALLSHNHGRGKGLSGERLSAVSIYTNVAGVIGNHVTTDSGLAFDVGVGNGLFTDNMANRDSWVAPGVTKGLNLDNLQ